MNIAALAGPNSTPACWEQPAAFAAEALDYTPEAEDYDHLDLIGHAALAAARTQAEDDAVNVCFECPLMLACEKADEAQCADSSQSFVLGVIGGRTEWERRVRTHAHLSNLTLDEAEAALLRRKPSTATDPQENPQIAAGDRGPRGQVDDDLVARLTIAGLTSDEIARELSCSTRTVTRARKRIQAREENPTVVTTHKVTDAETATLPATETVETPTETEIVVPDTIADLDTPVLTGGPRVSPAMAAIYTHLARRGGTDTFEDLLTVGMTQVSADDAIDWWMQRHSDLGVAGSRMLRPDAENVPTQQRIHEGARAKVRNMLCAACRKNRHVTRDGQHVSMLPETLAEWTARLDAQHALAG